MAWLKGVAGKSDEELAWDYLRNSQQTYQDEFRASLAFLVEKGSADTLVKLREVFLGLRSEALIAFQQRRTAMVKVLTGLLFLALAAFLLFGYRLFAR